MLATAVGFVETLPFKWKLGSSAFCNLFEIQIHYLFTPRSGAKPVCLPWPSIEKDSLRKIENLNNDENVVVTGWGRTSNNRFIESKKILRNKISQRHLLYLKTKTATDLCKEKLKDQADIDTDIQLCAGGEQGKQKFIVLIFP